MDTFTPPPNYPDFFQTKRQGLRRPVFLGVVLVFLVIGISVWFILSKNKIAENKNLTQEIATTTPVSALEIANWKTYQNKKYGFEIKYPTDHTVYSKIDTQKESLVPADLQSEKIAIAEKENLLFCCEPITLDLFIANENITSREWIDKNYTKYTNQKEIKSIKDIKFAETNATELIAGGNLGSTYRLLVISHGGYLLVINQNSESEFLDQVLSTFKLIENQTTQQPVAKDNNSISSPKDVYFAYRAELAQAKNPTDIKNIISKYSLQKSYQELLNQLASSPTDYQNSIFELIKNVSIGITNITVVSQEITESKAIFKMSAYDSSDQRNTNGTLVMIKENDSWKIDYEEWKSVPLK
ncbi:MAG: hypothetical protein Q8N81_06720 [bacterium]|nr:hypothetical protein [bacterium]